MDFSQLFQSFLVAALVLLALAGIADTVASWQMVHGRYRCVTLIRALRAMHIPAAVAMLCAVLTALAGSPTASVLALLVAFIATMLSSSRDIIHGMFRRVWLQGLAPWLLSLVALVNFTYVPTSATGAMPLPTSGFVLALLVAAGFIYIAHQRDAQALIALRD